MTKPVKYSASFGVVWYQNLGKPGSPDRRSVMLRQASSHTSSASSLSQNILSRLSGLTILCLFWQADLGDRLNPTESFFASIDPYAVRRTISLSETFLSWKAPRKADDSLSHLEAALRVVWARIAGGPYHAALVIHHSTALDEFAG
jgi:hypothetical protein